MDISKVIGFTSFLNKFNEVERTILLKWQDRWENDSEHSFQLTMLCWYMNDSLQLWLDTSKILKYALIHDLVEIYAWDTYFYTSNQKELDNKEKREHDAAIQIAKEFPEFSEMNKLIQEYELKADDESRFVYAVDKIIPVLNIYLDEWRTWKKLWVNLDVLLRLKTEKISKCRFASEFWQEFIKKLTKNQEKLFDI